MERRNRLIAMAAAATAAAAGVAAQRVALQRKRRNDPEAAADFGGRRGDRSRRIELPDGARLFVEEVGPENARRGVVFIHGSVLRTDVWYYQLAGLGGHRLLFYDLRGHGLSQPSGEAEFSIETLAGDLRAVIDDAGLEEVVFVGHSVGGMVALELCMREPELLGSRIKGLVLVNTTYGPAFETVVGGAAVARLERLLRRPLDVLGSQHERIERLRKIVRPTDAVFWGVALAAFGSQASARQIDFTYDMLAETPTDVIFKLIRSYRHFDAADALGDINVPALVIGGTQDRITLPKASEFLAERLPKAELRLLEGCGHMSMLERYRELNQMLEGFFTDVLGPPGDAKMPRRRGGREGRT